MTNKICVLGSINMDIVLSVGKMVKSGETILAKDLKRHPGGKGANQAVAAARLGANVIMIGKVGMDENADILLKKLKEDKVNTEYIYEDNDKPTGTAIITVDDNGNNSIIVVPGSNMNISSEEISDAEDIIKNSKILIAQFETSIQATIKAFKIAKENGVITILNPAPAVSIDDELLKYTDIIVPNETEAYELTGVKVQDEISIKAASDEFINKGVRYVIITLGERGAALLSEDEFKMISAYKVNPVDTTAAGDSFIGALAFYLKDTEKLDYISIIKAVEFGNKVSSIVVQRQGAQPSLPYLDEVIRLFKED